jgi:hypothetical protein
MKLAPSLRANWFGVVLLLLLSFAIYQNLTLGRINSALRDRLLGALSQPVAVGDRIGRLRGTGLDGSYSQIDPSPGGTLVVTISPFCGVCATSRPMALRLATFARAKGLRVVWVSRDSPGDTLSYFDSDAAEARLKDIVLSDPPHATYQALRLGLVPQAFIVDGAGAVRDSVPGGFTTDREQVLQKAMARQADGDRR